MPECVCGAEVSHDFVRVLGPREGEAPEDADVFGCAKCKDRTAIRVGAAAGQEHRVGPLQGEIA